MISLTPQLDFRAATAMSRIVKQEEPFACIRCNKPFGVKSTVERVVAKLEGQHWMFKDSKKRLDVIKMCADCRVNAMAEDNFDPFATTPRPRTTEDYLRERDGRLFARARELSSEPSEIGNPGSGAVAGRQRFTDEDWFRRRSFAENSTSALRSSAEPIVCSGILVPGV